MSDGCGDSRDGVVDVDGLDLDDWYDVEHEEPCRNAD